MDAVYPMSNGSNWNDNELRYSLRALERNFPELDQVWMLGYCPNWLTNVRHLPLKSPYDKNKDANLINVIILACLEADLSEEFLFMSDDQVILKPMLAGNFKPWWVEDMAKLTNWGTSRYKMRLRATCDRLRSLGFPTYNFEGHVPYIYNKHRFPRMALAQNYGYGYGYTINTLYYSQWLNPEEYPNFQDLQVDKVRAGFFNALAHDQIEQNLSGKTFIAYDDTGLTTGLKATLERLFPEPSKFEK